MLESLEKRYAAGGSARWVVLQSPMSRRGEERESPVERVVGLFLFICQRYPTKALTLKCIFRFLPKCLVERRKSLKRVLKIKSQGIRKESKENKLKATKREKEKKEERTRQLAILTESGR